MFFFEPRPYREFSPLLVADELAGFLPYLRRSKYELIQFDNTDDIVQIAQTKKLPIYNSPASESVLTDDLGRFFTQIVAQLNITHLYLWESIWEQPNHFDLVRSFCELFDIKVFSANLFVQNNPNYMVLGNRHLQASNHIFSLPHHFLFLETKTDFVKEEGYIIAGGMWHQYAASIKRQYPDKDSIDVFDHLTTDLRHYLY